MELIGEYDEIEIPPVKPYVVRHRRFACRCAHCGAGVKAPAPTGCFGFKEKSSAHTASIWLRSSTGSLATFTSSPVS
jgi:hypothetical protein